MAEIKDNTVPSENQLKVKERVFFENKDGKGTRVLFAGNSITMHGYAPQIGWFGRDYGMAASCKEKDYVHLIMQDVQSKEPDAAFCICQVANWERGLPDRSKTFPIFEKARDFDADVIIMRFVENCPMEHCVKENFMREYTAFIDFLNKSGKAKIILTTGFWKHPLDEAIQAVGKKYGYPIIYLGDLSQDQSMMALDKFEHTGVGAHPGDRGMAEIARRILAAM